MEHDAFLTSPASAGEGAQQREVQVSRTAQPIDQTKGGLPPGDGFKCTGM